MKLPQFFCAYLVAQCFFRIYDGGMAASSQTTTTTPEATPATLKAIAHPVRLSLYEALLASGPSTASRLSSAVPKAAPASLSYHLRLLAQHGFIEEAPELGTDGREHWWRAIPGGISWSDEELAGNPGTRKAASEAEAVLLGRQMRRVQTWVHEAYARWPAKWRAAARNEDSVLELDVDELRQLGEEIDAVLAVWRQRTSERVTAPGENGRESVFVSLHAFPFNPAHAAPK